MHTTGWDEVRYFLVAARHGSFARAARTLGVEQTTVARRVTALEEQLGTQLMVRSRSGLRLTAAGEEVLARAERAEGHMADIERLAGTFDDEPLGEVALATSAVLAAAFVAPSLSSLRERHPALILTLQIGRGLADLPRREADVALRLRPAGAAPGAADVLVQKLGVLEHALCASREYARGKPPFEEAPSEHSLLRYGRAGWEPGRAYLERIGTSCTVARADDMTALRELCVAGVGAAVLPLVYATQAGLEPLVRNVDEAALYVAVHPDLRRVPRVAAVVEWLRSEVGERLGASSGARPRPQGRSRAASKKKPS